MDTPDVDPEAGGEAAGWEQLSIVDVGGGSRRRAKRAKSPREEPLAKGKGEKVERRGVKAKKKDEAGAEASAAGEAGTEAGAAPSLEKALDRLEEIVRQLEAGNIDLDRSLALFEEGVTLSRSATKRLNEAEARISRLVRSLDGEFRTEPLDGEASGGGADDGVGGDR